MSVPATWADSVVMWADPLFMWADVIRHASSSPTGSCKATSRPSAGHATSTPEAD